MDNLQISSLEAKKQELINRLRQMEFEYNTLMGQVQGIDMAISTILSISPLSESTETKAISATPTVTTNLLQPNRRQRLSTDKQKIYECLRDAKTSLSPHIIAEKTGLKLRYVQQTLVRIVLYQGNPKDIGKDGEKYFLTEEGKKFLAMFPPLMKSGLSYSPQELREGRDLV